VHFWLYLTQYFSWQQTKRFLVPRDRKSGYFRFQKKFYLAEMKPLQKLARRTLRMVMRQKTMCFPFPWPARVREKRLSATWKSIVSGALNDELP